MPNLVVLVTDDHMRKQDDVIDSLKEMGVSVHRIEHNVGIIHCSCDVPDYCGIEKIDGVSHVRRDL